MDSLVSLVEMVYLAKKDKLETWAWLDHRKSILNKLAIIYCILFMIQILVQVHLLGKKAFLV